MHDDDTTPGGDATRDVQPDPTPLFAARTGPDTPVSSPGGQADDVAPTHDADPDATTAIATVTARRRDDATAPGRIVADDDFPGRRGGVPGDGGSTSTSVTSHDPDPGRSPWSWLVLAIPLVVLLAAAVWIGSLFQDRAGEALPGVTVEGFDAGGMTEDEITTELQGIVDARRAATITVTAADASYDYQLGDDGYGADVDSTVDRALAAGRDGPLRSVVNQVRASMGNTSWTFDLEGVSVDRDVDDFLAGIDDDLDREPTAGSITIDPDTLEVIAVMPEEGQDAKVEDVQAELVALLGTGQDAELTVPVEVLEPLVDPGAVEATVDRATAVLDESYVLVTGDDALTIDPSEIAPLLSIEETDDAYDVVLDVDGVRELLGDGRGDRFASSPSSASYRVVSGNRTFDDKGSATFEPSPARVDVVEGSTGREFNPDVATDLLVSLFDAEEHRGEFDLDVVQPSFTTKEARQQRPDALLGTFTTYHDAGGARVFNIHLLADMIAGEVLPPGDDFSVNRDIGDRTEAKGFKPAGAIKEGEIIDDDIGGGVSQLATTFYNAAFFAGIDVLSWQPHSLPISRYPLAREATFSYAGGLDIHILNDTEGALVVDTSYTSTSITVSIFGQDDGRTVSAQMGQPKNFVDFDVVERTTDELPAGQTRTVQSGGEGFTVDYRRVIKGGTTPGSENFSWTYSPKPTIIETGTG